MSIYRKYALFAASLAILNGYFAAEQWSAGEPICLAHAVAAGVCMALTAWWIGR